MQANHPTYLTAHCFDLKCNFLADIDGSGAISKDEALLCARMSETVFRALTGGPSVSKTSPIIVGRKIIDSLFRIFDDDKDGKIQASELASILSSWIGTILNLAVETLDLIEDLLFDDAVKTAALQIGMGLEMFPKDGSGSIIVDQALKTLLDNLPDQASAAVVSQVNMGTQQATRMAQSFVPDIDARFKTTTKLYDGLIARLDSMAVNGQLSKDVAVEAMTPVCCEIIENFLSLEVVSRAKAQPMEGVNSMLEQTVPFSVPPNLLDDLINTIVISLRTFFRSGGLKQFLQAFFDLLDVNRDGVLSKEEMKNLADATSLLFKVCPILPVLHLPCVSSSFVRLFVRFCAPDPSFTSSTLSSLTTICHSSDKGQEGHSNHRVTSNRPGRRRSGSRRGCGTGSPRRPGRTSTSWTRTRTASSARPSSRPSCARRSASPSPSRPPHCSPSGRSCSPR